MLRVLHARTTLALLVSLVAASCVKLETRPTAPPNFQLRWIVGDRSSDKPIKALGDSQHRLLTGLGLVRFAGTQGNRRVVPFLATEWESVEPRRWKFVVAPFFDSAGRKIPVSLFVEALRERLEARATPCGSGAQGLDPLARLVERTFPSACEGKRFRLLPEVLTAATDSVEVRTAEEAPWLPWLLAQASLWVGSAERPGGASWGEFRWVEASEERLRYRRNVNFAAFVVGKTPRAKSPAGPVRDVELEVLVVREPELRAVHAEEGNADIVDGIEPTWSRHRSFRVVENEEGHWLVAPTMALAPVDCELLRRQTGEHWVAASDSERETMRFLVERAGDAARWVAPLTEPLREALAAQSYVAAMNAPGRAAAAVVPQLAGIGVFTFPGAALTPLSQAESRRAEVSAHVVCTRKRLSLRASRLDEWQAVAWEPGAGWNIAADSSGLPSAMLYDSSEWPVDKR